MDHEISSFSAVSPPSGFRGQRPQLEAEVTLITLSARHQIVKGPETVSKDKFRPTLQTTEHTIEKIGIPTIHCLELFGAATKLETSTSVQFMAEVYDIAKKGEKVVFELLHDRDRRFLCGPMCTQMDLLTTAWDLVKRILVELSTSLRNARFSHLSSSP